MPSPDPTRRARDIWAADVPGFGNQSFFAGGRADVVHAGDGDGVLFANLRFRSFDGTTGREIASIRTGTTVRCLTHFDDGDLLVATDHRLHRLDAETLSERQRWERQIPHYVDSMARYKMTCVVANWQGPSAALIDLVAGTVRRRSWVPLPRVVEAPEGPYLLASGIGTVARIEIDSGRIHPLFTAASARDATVVSETLWIIEGRPEYGAKDPGEGRSLRAYEMGAGVERLRLALPASANRLQFGGGSLWAWGRSGLAEISVSDPMVVGFWPAPHGHLWVAVDPNRRRALCVEDSFARPAVRITCHALEG